MSLIRNKKEFYSAVNQWKYLNKTRLHITHDIKDSEGKKIKIQEGKNLKNL